MFSCMDCLAAEATHNFNARCVCELCLRKRLDDAILDRVKPGDGETVWLDDDGHPSFTLSFAARVFQRRAR
jgi:hypothetical protein